MIDLARFLVNGQQAASNPLDEAVEIGCNCEVAARLHAVAFTADGRRASIYDCLSKQFVSLSTQPTPMVQ